MVKRILLAAPLVLGLGLCIFFIAYFGGITKTLAAVHEVGWIGLTVYVATASLTLVFPAIGWKILMHGEGLKVPLWTALKANFMGFPLNFIAPTLYLGSEPLKLLYVSNKHEEPRRRVLATIIVNKFQEFGGLLLVMLVAVGISLWRVDFTRGQEVFLISSMIILTVAFTLLLYAFLGNLRPTVRVINMLAAFGMAKRKLARLRSRAEEMEELVRIAFTQRWKTCLASQAVTLLSAASILMRPWVFFYFMPARTLLPVEYLCAIYVVTNIINSFPHTPGGLGIFEGGIVLLFSQIGMAKEDAASFLLMNRVADLFLILLGSWMIVHYNMQAIARRVARGEEKVTVAEAKEGEAEAKAAPQGTSP